MNMSDQSRPAARKIARRAILRGAGVTMALPWLESFAAKAATSGAAFPKRFGVVFLGCGVNEDHWSAQGSGADMKLSKSLMPLDPLKQKINVIDGLFNPTATGLGIHPPQTGSLLTGAHMLKGSIVRSGTSVDQMIAQRVGQDTLQPSLVLPANSRSRVSTKATSRSRTVRIFHGRVPTRRYPTNAILRSRSTRCLRTAAA